MAALFQETLKNDYPQKESKIMFTQTFLGACLLTLISCADPQYANLSNNPQKNQDDKIGTCVAKFSSGICLNYTWEKLPTENDFGILNFKTFIKNSVTNNIELIDLPIKPSIVLWMPSMGHGSSPVTIEHIETGIYRATKVFFIMSGSWQIRFQLKDRNEIKDQIIIPFNF